ncbi:MAG: acyltransferase [Chloroflexota bacterium]
MSRQLGAFSGLAMILIVLNHAIHMGLEATTDYGGFTLAAWERTLLSVLQGLGVFAVPIFLFVSGSFVAYAARARRVEGISYQFIWAGLRHILIPYLIWSLIFYLVVYLLRGEQHTALGYVKNILVGYPYHFIPLLVFFYLLAPILVYLSRRWSWLILLLVGAYQLFLLNARDPAILGVAFPESWQLLVVPVLTKTMADWGIYFPLGLVFSLHMGQIRPYLQRFKWIAAGLTLLFFVLALLDANGMINLAIARFLCPLTFILLIPIIERSTIPLVRHLEKIGKKAYGLYLTHLLILEIVVLLIGTQLPQLLNYPLILYPLLFGLAVLLPLLLMDTIARSPTRPAYRYLFG